YVSSSNTNDTIPAAFLIWGFWLVTSAWARGIFAALSSWTKFATLVVAPMWLTYPELSWRPRRLGAFAGGVVLATAAAFFPLQLAALTGALLIGFELVLTHWFYLYIPWFFPFVAFAFLAPRGRPDPQPEPVH